MRPSETTTRPRACFVGSGERRKPRGWRGLLVALAALALGGAGAGQAPEKPGGAGPPLIRVGFSTRTMGDRNRNDVTASLKAWIQTIAQERGLSADPTPHVFDEAREIVRAMKEKEIDVITASSDEFVIVEKEVAMGRLYAVLISGRCDEEYVLVVRKDGGLHGLADLRGRRLLVAENPRTTLARPWLEVELAKAKLPPSEQLLREVARTPRVNKALLPVFFNQADACLLTRRNFELAGELNPQISKMMEVLAASPALIPAVGSHRAGLAPGSIDRYFDEVLHLDRTNSGKQILRLFECDSIRELKPEEFASTREFLAEHARLVGGKEKEGAPP